MRMFKTVTLLLKQTQQNQSNRNAAASLSSSQIKQELRQAEMLLALQSNKKHKKRSLVDICTIDDDDDTAKHDAILYGSSSSVVFPLRLRDVSVLSSLSTHNNKNHHFHLANLSYLTAIVLYNFGLASQCSALYHPTRQDFVRGAQQTLRSAKLLLLCSADKCCAENLYDLYRYDMVLQLVQQSLQQVTRQGLQTHDNNEDVDNSQRDEPRHFVVNPDDAAYVQSLCDNARTFAPAA